MNQLFQSLRIGNFLFRGEWYSQLILKNAIDHLAGYLSREIHSSSPFIVLSAYNNIKTVIAYYAILKLGKIAVILDPSNKAIEITEIISDVDPAAIFYLNNSTSTFEYAEELVFRKTDKSFLIGSDLKGVCTIAYTNAEDGFAKGAMLTEENLMAEIRALAQTVKIDNHSVSCALLPFSHLYGLLQGILVPAFTGSTSIITDLDFCEILDKVKNSRELKISNIFSVPSIYYLLAKIPNVDLYVAGVQNLYSGGNKLSPKISENFFQKTNRRIREGYGLTESSPGCILNYQEEDPNSESIGLPMPGCEIKTINEQNDPCKPNEIGELCIKGPLVFKGYFNNPSATNSTLFDGWLHTGDYARIDAKGFVYYCGLKKEMINVAGNNVYPKRLERMMLIYKNAHEVLIQSEESILQGQIVKATIKLKNNSHEAQDEFKNWCLKNINNITLPKQWFFE